MDQAKYTTLVEGLSTLIDPRQARGKRYSWMLLLTLIAIAIASGQRTVHAIADWIAQHWEDVRTELHPVRITCPSEATFRRALRLIDPLAMEDLLTHLDVTPSPPPTECQPLPPPRPVLTATPRPAVPLQAQAVDGKELRGALAHGEKVHLVSLVRHADAITVAQTAVDQKSNEIPAVPKLLVGRNLTGTVTTMDALLTQRTLAQQIRHQGGHYFMVVKANQPELHQAIELLFACPPWTKQEQACEYDVYQSETRGHGRMEQRTLESSTALCQYVDWPDVGQVMRRTCRRIIRKTGVVSEKVTYAITSLTHPQAKAKQLEAIWRGHWTIENRVHYVRDVTLGEDACQTHVGNAPRVLAAIRDAILNLFRAGGWENISDAVRHYAAKVVYALDLQIFS
jgi:predicted transposase YbfD/YdcC